ncbi:nitrite reductase small subunit NirD [Vibrio marisflavi]|uniref:Nitrite reductase (NADH) small subunit n=1 Tax=Vibrio marisflavi CECT 7928 TaxID=634439 RepID=A0ABN8E3B2_9VIBR|nr:nitrite reductase small subunit NirD [Vibrio marisflavi]CAH0539075.1 Nitrite reductase (NADH) small subunit [Vibrio marisflavi CECT 7928]
MKDWLTVCNMADLVPQTGICAKVYDDQVAIFYCERTQQIYALSNFDPAGKANVMSRGIIGSIEGAPYVASPLYKHHFHLEDGSCLEDPSLKVKTYEIRAVEGDVQVAVVA